MSATSTTAAPGIRPRLDDLIELRHQAVALGVASRHLVNTSFSGLYASVFRGMGLEYEEAREYRPGDDIRQMDWKVTARSRRPHVKVYREEREREVVLCVDTGPHMQFGTRGTFKSVQAARAAALLGWAANRNHDRVGGLVLGTGGREGVAYYRPTRGRRSLWRLLHGLSAEPDAEGGRYPLDQALKMLDRAVATGSVIFVIADFNFDPQPLEIPLGRLRQRHSVVLIPVDDPRERELPPMGRVVFRGPRGEKIEVDTDDAEARAAYAERWRRTRQALLNMAGSLGLAVIPIDTGEDVHRSLQRGMEQLNRMHRTQ